MALSTLRRACCWVIAVFAFLCLAGCAVPLAPGYKIEKQSITVRFIPGSPPHLAVRAEYRLANVGNSRLDSIEVGLPDQKSFGLQSLRVLLNGREVIPEIAQGAEAEEGESVSSESWPVVWRIPFSPSWHRKQKRNLVIEYDLSAAAAPHGRMYVAPTMFYLNDSGWFPDPLAPKSFFARDLVRPDPSDLSVIVPQTFLATGSGELRGSRKSGVETEFHLRLRKDDFDPFIIAGQYHEQRITAGNATVAIWTSKPVLAAPAQTVGKQIADAIESYSQTFGPLPRSMTAIYDVELPEDDTAAETNQKYPSGFVLPGVVSNWSLSPGKGTWPRFSNTPPNAFGHAALGFTWLGHMIRPRPEAWLLAEGLIAYVSDLQNKQADAGSSRSDAVVSGLKDYDQAIATVVEKPVLALTSNDSDQQLQIGGDKFMLFLFALEDKCGRDNLNHAIAHMISALRFQQYGYDDFRSAVEEECHQDLGAFFREWLTEKSIPADFRAKYEAASEQKN